jgi:hypothetical protein
VNPDARIVVSAPRTQSGPVAQLGARLNGIQEVTGSIPVRSTNHSAEGATVGLSLKNELRPTFFSAHPLTRPLDFSLVAVASDGGIDCVSADYRARVDTTAVQRWIRDTIQQHVSLQH